MRRPSVHSGQSVFKLKRRWELFLKYIFSLPSAKAVFGSVRDLRESLFTKNNFSLPKSPAFLPFLRNSLYEMFLKDFLQLRCTHLRGVGGASCFSLCLFLGNVKSVRQIGVGQLYGIPGVIMGLVLGKILACRKGILGGSVSARGDHS